MVAYRQRHRVAGNGGRDGPNFSLTRVIVPNNRNTASGDVVIETVLKCGRRMILVKNNP